MKTGMSCSRPRALPRPCGGWAATIAYAGVERHSRVIRLVGKKNVIRNEKYCIVHLIGETKLLPVTFSCVIPIRIAQRLYKGEHRA